MYQHYGKKRKKKIRKKGSPGSDAAQGNKTVRVTEESPDWNPYTMGNKKGGGAYYYKKRRNRSGPD